MKKIFIIAFSAASLADCNSSGTTDNTAGTTDSTGISATALPYTPTEGDVTFSNDSLMVYRKNEWVPETDRVIMGNGVVVYTTGEVKKGIQTGTLTDGEIVSHDGNLFDKTGKAVKDAWDTTKHWAEKAGEAAGKAAGDAGKAVGHAAGKVANAVKKTVDKDKN
jgi:hypothetical protein